MTQLKPGQLDAIIFDYGAVLCHVPKREQIEHMASLIGMPADEFWRRYPKSRDEYDRGTQDSQSYWDEFARDAGVSIASDKVPTLVAHDMALWSCLNEDMMAVARSARAAGFKTAILSNMQHDLLHVLRRSAAWLGEFDVQVFSCEHKRIKPEPEIYHIVLDQLGVVPGRAYFIDDNSRNIEGARALGINAHLFRSADEVRSELAPVLNGHGRRHSNGTARPSKL